MTGTDSAANGDTSVILTCYNEGEKIVEAVKSVLAQTAFDRVREVIVVDDGSTDDSADLVEALAANEPKLRLIRTQNGGVSSARNKALANVSGDLIAFLDGDDIWLPDKLEIQLPYLARYPAVGLVYSDFYEFDDGAPDALDRVHTLSYQADDDGLLVDYYLRDAPVMPSTMIVRKQVFDELGGFNETLPVNEDTEMCLRIAEKFRFHHIPQALVKKRRHAGSLSSQQDRLWPYNIRLTDEFADRNPSLKPLARKRLSLRAAKVGWGMIQVGDRMAAVKFLLRSLRYDPRQIRGYAYIGLACVPRVVAVRTHRLIRSMRAVDQADTP